MDNLTIQHNPDAETVVSVYDDVICIDLVNIGEGLQGVWHHIYNFGNVGMFIGMGNVLKEATVDSEGKARMKRWLPLGMTADERMCSGAHYAAFFASMVKYIDNPALLEVPPETVKYGLGGKLEYHVPKVKKAEN